MIYLPTALGVAALDEERRRSRTALHAVLAREAGFLDGFPDPRLPHRHGPGRGRRLVAGSVRAISSAAYAVANAACSAATRIEGTAH